MNEKKFAQKMLDDYQVTESTKGQKLKSLDNKVKTPALVFAYTFGVHMVRYYNWSYWSYYV